MPFRADNPKQFDETYGKEGERNIKVGSGECVDFIKEVVAALRNTIAQTSWKRGKRVKGNFKIPPYTAIGFFDKNGDYASASGKSHVAIYIGQDQFGIKVWHQYGGHHPRRPHTATLYFKSAHPKRHFSSESMNGDNFYVLEMLKDPNPESF